MAEFNSQNNDETELTMCDVLEEEQELEDDANAVLGGSDDTNCSYDKGYVKRQALYACTTCSAGQEPSGVCLACSYKCHDGHEIVELYTKRNFRCDCGNSKFAGKACSLKPDKDPVNELNKYNQNFKGLYCSCSRPYPDLEDDTLDEMIQCIMCEDWYHGRHIGNGVPDDYSEMICKTCMQSHKFLYVYLNKFHYVNVTEKNEDKEKYNGTSGTSVSFNQPERIMSPTKVDSETVKGDKMDVKSEQETIVKHENSDSETLKEDKIDVKAEQETIVKHENKDSGTLKENKIDVKAEQETIVEHENSDSGTLKEDKIDVKSEQETIFKHKNSDICLLAKLSIKSDGITQGPAFWPENWRKELCRCSSCIDLYHKHECEYLLNLDDTILAYEECGKSTGESQYDKGLNALSKLDRVKQMEAIRAYTSMKGQLKEYLKDFASSKRTVCESDIKEFFDRISKRQKLNNGVPHFCR